MAARFLQLPMSELGNRMTDAIRYALAYYSNSEAKEAIIIRLRLLHLYQLKVLVERKVESWKQQGEERVKQVSVVTDEPSAVQYLNSSTQSVYFIAHLWKRLRSPTYGLNSTLLDAIKATQIGEAGSDRAEQSMGYFGFKEKDKRPFHTRFCANFEQAMNEMDAVLLDATASKEFEQKNVDMLKRWLEEHPREDTIYLPEKRMKHGAEYFTDTLVDSWLKPFTGSIETLATEMETGYWSASKRAKLASITTGDAALKDIVQKAQRRDLLASKRKGKRIHDGEEDDFYSTLTKKKKAS